MLRDILEQLGALLALGLFGATLCVWVAIISVWMS
jgi:hypothetical protein